MGLPRQALPLVLGLAAFLGPAAPAPALVTAPSLSALATRAERIIVSEVIEVRCELDASRGDDAPVTLVTVRVWRTLKGTGGSQLVLEFLGGSVGDDALDVFDVPRFAVGDRDVLFLSGDARRVSPLVGVMHGRFRVIASAESPAERVAAPNGRLLTEADLAGDLVAHPTASTSSRPVSLASFEQAVVALVGGSAARAPAGTGPKPRAATTTDTTALAQPGIPGAPLRVHADLGASPALADGCPDWRCALQSKDWFHRLSANPAEGETAAAPAATPVSLEWGQSVFGRLLDADTLALSMIRTRKGETSARVVFNQQLAWNAYPTASAAPTGGPIDLASVAARELSLVVTAVGSSSAPEGVSSVPPVARGRATARRLPSSRAAALSDPVEPTASACGPADVYVDPRLLAFDSPDHALMTAYQVGFFQPGAASPAQVLDVPLSAFLLRRVVDLPAWAVLAMQTSLVADIRSAGLATPIGVVYTYRVRGVWAGGTTAWSESSQPFVRCSAAAAIR